MLIVFERYSLLMNPPEGTITPLLHTDELVVPNIAAVTIPENPHKNYVELLVITTLFGFFGVDRFYLGKVGTGLAKLVTFGGFGLWYCTDAIIALSGAARQNGSDLPLQDTAKYKPFFVKMATYSAILFAVFFVVQVVLFALAVPKLIDQVKGASSQVQQGNGSSPATQNIPSLQNLL